jgi:hypothetical protein
VRLTAMTRDGLGAYRLWGRDDDERTPLVSREGCVRQALRVGNIPRIALIGLIGIVALACMGGVISHAPARRDSEVETKISSALGSFMESPVHNEMVPATEPTNGDVATLGGKSYAYVFAHMVNHKSLVDWALGQGANGVEIDLTFSGGNPTEFRHGAPCDCTCLDINPLNPSGGVEKRMRTEPARQYLPQIPANTWRQYLPDVLGWNRHR